MTLKKVVSDFECNGCGAKASTNSGSSVSGLWSGPKGWSADVSSRSRRRVGGRHLCGACTRAVATARRTALAARRKRSKK